MIQELRTGGAERIAVTLCRSARERGHDIAVAAADGELEQELLGSLSVPRFPLPVVRRQPARVPIAALRLRAAVRDFSPDVVHAHNPAMAMLVSLAGRRRGSALVSVHGVPEHDWPATGRVLRLSRLPVVACGPGVAAALVAARCRPVATIANAVAASPERVSREELLHRFALPSDSRTVLVVGRLARQKNQQLAIRALTRLPRDFRLLLVGEGEERQPLETLAEQLGVADRVTFAGRISGRPLMSAVDVNCLPSLWEGLPLAAIEAMMSGRPVVATAVRGTRELIDDGRTGLLVTPDDPAALSDAISRLVDDPQLADRLASAAAEEASSWTDSAMADAYLRLYEELGA